LYNQAESASATFDYDSRKVSNQKKLVVIKDLSELGRSDYKYLDKMADSIVGNALDERYLVAANDGQLVEAWGRARS